MNKLTEIVQEYNNTCRKANEYLKTISDDKGLYNSLNILMDIYIQNNSEPTTKKPNVIKYFFEDLDDAVNLLKKDYRAK